MNAKILLVDDEQNVLSGYRRQLRKKFQIDTALSGREGLEIIDRDGPFAVIVSDMNMPEMNGVQFLCEAQKKAPDTVRLMLTGNADQKTAVDAVNRGNVFRFVNKPCPPEELLRTLEVGVRHYELITAERELLEGTVNGIIKSLTEILSMVLPEAFGRAEMLRDLAVTVAPGFEIDDSWALEMAAMLSPIAMVTVPKEILAKKRQAQPLSEQEQQVLADLPEVSNKLLGNIPRLERVAEIIQYHQKNFDGTGFPSGGLNGAEMPVESRILKVLSDLSEMEDRGLSSSAALTHMARQSGRYDPEVLETVVRLSQEDDVQLTATIEIKVSELRPGHKLAGNIDSVEGRLLVASGHRVSAAIVERLHNFARVVKIKEPIYVKAAVAAGEALET